jgi:hypothetical protein
MSPTVQRLIMGAMVGLAVLALALGALYQDEDRLDDGPAVVGGDASAPVTTGGSGAAPGGDAAASDSGGSGGPIEGFLPTSGEASACREPVGVDLIPGYGAILSINGIEIPPEAMNVNLDENGEVTNEITASRSIGHFTFKPDDDCPNGTYLRPTGNVLEVCVYRLSDEARRCVRQERHVFDAI